MKVERFLKREVICYNGQEFNISTTSADMITWIGAYVNGYREPKYPVPAIRQGFDFIQSLDDNTVHVMHWEHGVIDAISPYRRK